MFAANAELDTLARRPAPFGCKRDELAHTFHIEADEGIALIDALFDILRQEACRIVAADTQRRLRQIVGAEGEEMSGFRDFPAISAARGNSIIVPTI